MEQILLDIRWTLNVIESDYMKQDDVECLEHIDELVGIALDKVRAVEMTRETSDESE